jgi:Leucine-rich repeat (LRR) protein
MERQLAVLLWLGAMSSVAPGCMESPMHVSPGPIIQTKDRPATERPAPEKKICVVDRIGIGDRVAGKSDSVEEALSVSRLKQNEVDGVSFQQHELTEDDLTAMRALPNLQAVWVCGSHTSDVSVERVSQLRNLRQVTFYATKITDEGLEYLKALRHLEKLSVTGNWKGISDAGLARSLAELTELRELRLCGDSIGDAGLTFLRRFDNLRTLELCSGRLTDAGLAQLGTLRALEVLTLRCPSVTGGGLSHLSELKSLQKLTLGGSGLTVAGMAHIRDLTQISECHLEGDGISNDMLRGFEGNTTLESLELQCDSIGDAGLEHLKGMTNLESLYLSGRHITDAGLEHLKQLTGLRQLTLDRRVQVSGRAVKLLQKALPKCEVHRS